MTFPPPRSPGSTPPVLSVRLAADPADLLASFRLRYAVFVTELGADGPLVDHVAGLEQDRFDPYVDHLLLVDDVRPHGDHVVGVYRLMRDGAAATLGQFYAEDEFDLTRLRKGGRRLLELGRSCLHPEYRGGHGMYLLWHGLSDYVIRHEIEILFGVASFHGTDVAALAAPLSYLHHTHLAPPDLRVRACVFQSMDLIPMDAINRPAAIRAIPALIKAYLRLGGMVGDGAFVDRAFNTVDVCLMLDTNLMTADQTARYTKSRAASLPGPV